jgi:hypothetical protein
LRFAAPLENEIDLDQERMVKLGIVLSQMIQTM